MVAGLAVARDYSDSPMQFLLWLRLSKLNKAGTAPVYLRIFLDNFTRVEYATNIRCRPDRWQGGERKIKGQDAATRNDNATLDTLKSRARLLASDMQTAASGDPARGPVMPADVAAALRGRKPQPPARLLALLAAALPAYSQKPGTRHNAGQALRWFTAWPPAAGLTLACLTPERAAQYALWLAQQSPAVSSKRVYLGTLAGLVAAAPTHPPVFAKLARLLGTPPEKRHLVLPADWQAQLLALKLPRAQALARDVFLLQYYLHGSRIGVVLELQWKHIDYQQQRVRFVTHKRPVQMDILLRPEICALLARYQGHGAVFVLPALPADYLTLDEATQFHKLRVAANCVGVALKGICRKLGWPDLHSHLARHTLALRAYENNDKDLRVPQQLLGHKNIQTTATYIASLTTTELDAGAANAYD